MAIHIVCDGCGRGATVAGRVAPALIGLRAVGWSVAEDGETERRDLCPPCVVNDRDARRERPTPAPRARRRIVG